MRKKEVPLSIIIPSFDVNKSEPALRHILKQDYPDFEIIIINDNPKLELFPEIIKFIQDNKIRLIENPRNLGIAKSLNEGIKAAKTDVIIILCADYFPESNQWLKHVIEKLYSDEKIGQVVSTIENEDKVWKEYSFLIKLFSFRNMLKKSSGGGGNYKKEVFQKVGLFDTKTFRFAGEDGDMHYRMKKAGYKVAYISDSITHDHCDKNDKLLKIFRKEFHYGIGHGARKRKYGLIPRIGFFDFDIRLLFIIGVIIGLFIHPLISLVCLLPFFFAAFKQTLNPFSKTKWIPGLLFYPFVGIFIFLIQTLGAVRGYFWAEQDKHNRNIEYLEDN